jgi:hypothetical protein
MTEEAVEERQKEGVEGGERVLQLRRKKVFCDLGH